MNLKEKINNNQFVKRLKEPKNKFHKGQLILGGALFIIGGVAALPVLALPAAIVTAGIGIATYGAGVVTNAALTKKGAED